MAGLNLREQAQLLTEEDLRVIAEKGSFVCIAQDIRNAIAERQRKTEASKYAVFNVDGTNYYLNGKKIAKLKEIYTSVSHKNPSLGEALSEVDKAINVPQPA